MADLSPDQILDLVKKYESQGGQNIPNYRYDPGHTAQGYYQITDTNWKDYGPKVGVDLSKYPHAMAAPEEVQRKVAHHLLTQTPKGALNWESPEFRKAVGVGEMPQEQQNYGDMSDEELRKLVMKDPELSKRVVTQTTKTDQKKSEQKTLTVKSPEAGWSKFLREFGESKTPQDFMHGGMIIPGLKQMARGISEPGGDWRSHTADVIEGGGRVMAPVGIGALLGLTGGAGFGALAEGEGAMGALGAATRAAIPFAKGAAGGAAGYGIGQLASQDPETRRVASDIGGLAGSIYGPRASMPKGRFAPAMVRTLGNILPIPGSKHVGNWIADSMLSETTPKPAPTGKVEKPSTLPRTPEMDDAVHFGNTNEIQFKAHMKKLGMTDEEAQTKWDNAVSRSNKIKTDEANVAAKDAQAKQERAAREAKRDAEKAAAAQPKGPSAKDVETLKDMVKSGQITSDQFRQNMSQWLSPDEVQHHIQDALGQRFSPGPQFKVQPQGIPASSIPAQPQGAPQGLVQPPTSGFNQPMGVESTGGELSGLTKFKPQFGPVGPVHGPEPEPFKIPEPEPPAEIPIASTKMVNNAAKELFKGSYDLDKIPADNRDWRAEFRDKAKLGSVPTEKSVREAMGIARIMRAKVARGEKIPGIKIGRNEKGQWVRIEEP